MGGSTATEPSIRLLGLGNEILADDAFGIWVSQEVQRRFGAAIDVVASSEAGFSLIDHLLGASCLVVVDTILTGKAKPGTIHVFEADHMRGVAGNSPHFLGLFDVLALARELGLRVPRRVTIVAVKAADCSTVGGSMHRDVRAAIPVVADWVGQFLKAGWGAIGAEPPP
jgi:hydrogenase maturation protease